MKEDLKKKLHDYGALLLSGSKKSREISQNYSHACGKKKITWFLLTEYNFWVLERPRPIQASAALMNAFNLPLNGFIGDRADPNEINGEFFRFVSSDIEL